MAIKHPCRKMGCKELVEKPGYCPAHEEEGRRLFTSARYHGDLSSAKRGYGGRWQAARKEYLMGRPLCANCGRPATVVDHIRPHKGNVELFWDYSNWQPLCKACHDKKTCSEVMRNSGKEYTYG